MTDNLKLPTEDQVSRGAELLRQLRVRGNNRPGDDLWAMDSFQHQQQLRARATDMLVIMLSQDSVFNG